MKSAASTERAKAVAIYRDAARLVELELEEFACFAIERCGGDEGLCAAMKNIFRPRSEDIAWLMGLGMPESQYNSRHPLEIGGRVLALCFMAAMVEAGDA